MFLPMACWGYHFLTQQFIQVKFVRKTCAGFQVILRKHRVEKCVVAVHAPQKDGFDSATETFMSKSLAKGRDWLLSSPTLSFRQKV